MGREKRVRVSDPAGEVFVDNVYSVCDCLGKTARVSRPYRTGDPIYWTESRYDALGRPTQLIPPDGSETSNYLFYDYSQRNVTVTDPAGKKRKYRHELLDRISVVYEPDASNNLTLQTAYSYPPNEMSIIQGAQMRTFLFDYLGRLTSETHPENGTTTYLYDNNGNRTQKTDARGILTSTTYEKLNRPTQETYSDGTPTVTWAYDTGSLRKGRLYTVTNATAASTFTYNKMGQVIREDKTIEAIPFSLIRTYNLAGAQTSMTLPNGTKISNAYNSAGQLTQITSDWVDANHPAILATGFEYAPSGALTYVEYGNGTASSRSYNSSGQLKTLQHGPLGDPGGFLDYRYNYNEGTANNGQIVSIDDFNDTTKSFTYTYDTLGRLKTAATTGTHWGLSWTYDRYGNRLSQAVTKGTGSSISIQVNSTSNRITGYPYDAAGNTLDDGVHQYEFDAQNRVTEVDNGAVVYKYDGFGNRVLKETPVETTLYVLDSGEYRQGAWIKLTVSLAGLPFVEYVNGTTHFAHTDHLGTVRLRTDPASQVSEQWSAHPFGEEWLQSGGQLEDSQKFAGAYRDVDTLADRMGVRDYTNRIGRFETTDPVTSRMSDPQSLNKYAYARNDPINKVDSNGMFWAWVNKPVKFLEYVPEPMNELEFRSLWEHGPPNPYNKSGQVRGGGGGAGGVRSGNTFNIIVSASLLIITHNLTDPSQACVDLLALIGVPPADILATLQTVTFLDGTTSTNLIENLANIPYANNTGTRGWTVAQLFANGFPSEPADPLTPPKPPTQIDGWTPPQGPNIYLRPGNFVWATIVHEVLHKFKDMYDDTIMQAWNIPANATSSEISNKIRANCN